jgi:hypothetical protein
LARLGLPPTLAASPEPLGPIHATAVKRYQDLWEELRSRGNLRGVEAKLSEGVVTPALGELACAVGPQTADEFAAWARRNLVRADWQAALTAWRFVLGAVCQNTRQSVRIPPPAALAPLLAEICAWIGRERWAALEADVNRAAPPATAEDAELGLTESPQALALQAVARTEWTREALDVIVKCLSTEERQAVVGWGMREARRQGLSVPTIFETLLLAERP